MNYLILIVFALAPSFVWLLFFLKKDAHPESKRMILKIFLYGMLIALPALFIERALFQGFKVLLIPSVFIFGLNMFIGVAFVEEYLKYLVFKGKVSGSPELDEPTDVMIYMIIAALGFAAFENILILLPFGSSFLIQEAFFLVLLRFVGATFLHALSSGLVGYFLALSFVKERQRGRLLLMGLGTATLLHGLYNLSIIKIGKGIQGSGDQIKISDPQTFLLFTFILAAILLGLALFVTFGFRKLKERKSTCQI